jgi:hypothetical protein
MPSVLILPGAVHSFRGQFAESDAQVCPPAPMIKLREFSAVPMTSRLEWQSDIVDWPCSFCRAPPRNTNRPLAAVLRNCQRLHDATPHDSGKSLP